MSQYLSIIANQETDVCIQTQYSTSFKIYHRGHTTDARVPTRAATPKNAARATHRPSDRSRTMMTMPVASTPRAVTVVAPRGFERRPASVSRVTAKTTRRGAVVKTRASVDPKTEYASLGQVCAGAFVLIAIRSFVRSFAREERPYRRGRRIARADERTRASRTVWLGVDGSRS